MLLTIECAGRVLSLFTSESPEHGATEVALAIGVSKSKAHALLTSLTSVGLLRKTGRGRYQVGWRVVSLNRVLVETTHFHRHARPVMRALSHQFGELVRLGVLDDDRVMYIDRVAPLDHDCSAPLGVLAPAHVSAIGKVLLANVPHGFAIDHGEESEDHTCVAAPIVAPGPIVVAAIGMSGRTEQFEARADVYRTAVARAGRYVSRLLAASEAVALSA